MVKSTLYPLAVTLARLHTMSGCVHTQIGAPANAGWIAPLDYFAPDSPQFASARRATARRLSTTAPGVIASSLLQGYQWLVIACAVGCFLLDRRVPDLTPAGVRVHFGPGEEPAVGDETAPEVERLALLHGRFWALPGDPAAAHPDAQLVPDEEALRAALRTTLVAHFTPIIASLQTLCGGSGQGFWLNVADRSASSFIWLLQEQDAQVGIDPIRRELDSLLRTAPSPLYTEKIGVFELSEWGHTHCFHDRATCCYWYKTAGGEFCSTCPRRTLADRHIRLRHWLSAYVTAHATTSTTTVATVAAAGMVSADTP